MEKKTCRHLYIHVPFCIRKCQYCAFYSSPLTPDLEKLYLDALSNEFSMASESLQPSTVFVGGGTPSCLSEGGLDRLLSLVSELDLSHLTEYSMEINPATLTSQKISLLREYKINRISMGVQSLDESVLTRLGRIHSAKEAIESFYQLRECGFKNINLDMIFGVPGQSFQSFQETVQSLLSFEPEHLSCYEMTYEEGTPLTQWKKQTGYQVDEEMICKMYDSILEQLTDYQIYRYEVSNFAKKGHSCQHNIAYWRGYDYYGAGPAACSLLNGIRYSHTRDLLTYCKAMQARQMEWEKDEITPLQRAAEIAAVGLRMERGWLFEEFKEITGFDLREHWMDVMEKIVARGDGTLWTDGFKLTSKGLRFADLAAEDFLIL